MCFRRPGFKKELLDPKIRKCLKCGTINPLSRVISAKGCIKCGADLGPDARREKEAKKRPLDDKGHGIRQSISA